MEREDVESTSWWAMGLRRLACRRAVTRLAESVTTGFTSSTLTCQVGDFHRPDSGEGFRQCGRQLSHRPDPLPEV
jgi:hypothetical protein